MINEWKDNFDFYFQPVSNKNKFLNDKNVLEVGCGKGRHTFYIADIAKNVIAVDFGRAVDVALLNNKNKKNIHFIQADIYNLPFKNNSFDFVFSLGVLHHLPTPEQGFKKLVDLLRNGGGILVYVYHSFPKTTFKYYLLRFVNFFRNFTTRISHDLLYILCYPIAFFSYIIFVLPYKLFFKKIIKNGWPLGLYSNYPFEVLLNDTFDRFSAPIENRYSKEQIEKWYQNSGLKEIVVLGGGGWRIFGVK
jgi:SAM-dependent methyltransferase